MSGCTPRQTCTDKSLTVSGSAFPATLALQIRQLEPEGFKLDGVVTVIDCINFKGYEDTSPSAKVSAARSVEALFAAPSVKSLTPSCKRSTPTSSS